MTDIVCVFEDIPWKIDGKTRYTCLINKCHEEFFKFKDETFNGQSWSYEKLQIDKECSNLRLKGELDDEGRHGRLIKRI